MSSWAERIDWELEAIMYVDYNSLDGPQVSDYSVVLTVRGRQPSCAAARLPGAA